MARRHGAPGAGLPAGQAPPGVVGPARMTVKLVLLVAVIVGVCVPAAATAFWTPSSKADVPGAAGRPEPPSARCPRRSTARRATHHPVPRSSS